MTTHTLIRRKPKCASCHGSCRWSDDAWVCRKCGDEWYPDHGAEYAPPGATAVDAEAIREAWRADQPIRDAVAPLDNYPPEGTRRDW